MKRKTSASHELQAGDGQNTYPLSEAPEGETPGLEEAENHLARMAGPLPSGGGDLWRLVGVLTSGRRAAQGAGGRNCTGRRHDTGPSWSKSRR